MNLIFAGTPIFAVPALEALLRAGHHIRAVYTQPDRPAGRGRKLAASPVKQCAQTHGIEIRQPEKISGEEKILHADAPDAMIVIAYGLLLPPSILAIPRHGCINVHASLLPRWRGAAPIPRAIEAGDTETGVSIMQMEAGLDTGPVLAEARIPIHATDTAQTLHDRLAQLGAETLISTLDQLARGGVTPQPQDNAGACYAKKLSKEESHLDWTQPAAVLHRKLRALNPWPVASTHWRGKTLRLWEVAPLDTRGGAGAPGTIVQADAAGIRVQAGNGMLTITRLQAEGGKILAAADFLNGHKPAIGDRLGDAAQSSPNR
ncbi:methionyl-tRNA formyltransferase [Sulfuricaulis limicola]|uniref:Methionyl-tRNA formyltransferase n=1 Tax=Sulfuricaulis limicola TaxID=1620215 RepID=A0A1B4XC32_9GAMM|nr:methionyl-tRNA formyltransferase [Sulfuricaulis limicola]BAV32352.1 methionyl-tRNA formyltransferase [Sulfuricaulis limicola]